MTDRPPITGSMLHDLVACERRVHHDLHGDPSGRDPVSAFVQLLWSGGREHEERLLRALSGEVVDLRPVPLDRRAAATSDALRGSADVVIGGRLEADDLVGMPDLLQRAAAGWVAGDVKSGSGTEPGGRRPRKEYAVQVAFYAAMLSAAGAGSGDTAFVLDRQSDRVIYDLTSPFDRAGRSLAAITSDLVEVARSIRDGRAPTRGALSASCKLCHWHSVCERELVDADDPTGVAGLGRSLRDALLPHAATIGELANLEVDDAGRIAGARVPGLGRDRLLRFRERARLLKTPDARPYARRPLRLDGGRRELHFDIEADPSRDGFVYLHGFLERAPGATQGRYFHVFAESERDERDAFAEAMRLLTEDPDAMVYYYSKYERSSFRALAARHPEVCTLEEVESLFDPTRAVDLLFDVIMPYTEWPTRNLSIKTLARHLGFEWGDKDASGANSIAWFDEYAKTRDPAVRQRILDYNADDVRASAVVLDGLRALSASGPIAWPPAAPVARPLTSS